MTRPGPFQILICSKCRKRVQHESAYADEYGNPVHEECYISRLTGQKDLAGFIVLKYVNRTPSLASCARCQHKFFTPASFYNDPDGAEQYLRGKFKTHNCPDAEREKGQAWEKDRRHDRI